MTIRVKLHHCYVASIRADLVKNRARITFEATIDDQLLEAKRQLAILSLDDSPVDLTVEEQQLRLPLVTTGDLGKPDVA